MAMSRATFPYGLLACCLCLMVFYSSASAQSSAATLSGTVVDQDGALVPGANVTVINAATGQQRQATTSDGGNFTVPLLPPATYTIRVEHQGFAIAEVRNVVLNIGDQKALQIQLKAGDIKEAVTVQADTLTINQTDGSVSTVVDQNYVKNMPLNGRSFQSLILLTPGALTQTSQVSLSSTPGFGSSGLGKTG